MPQAISQTSGILSAFRILRNLSTYCIGHGKLKSKPILIRIQASISVRDFLLTYFCSSSVKRFIILVKLGEIGYSSFAAISTEIVARAVTYELRMFCGPVIWTNLSIMPVAMKRLSGLYSFFSCRSMIFFIAQSLLNVYMGMLMFDFLDGDLTEPPLTIVFFWMITRPVCYFGMLNMQLVILQAFSIDLSLL